MGQNAHTPGLTAEIADLLQAARWALELTDVCLKTWNGGRGSPANVAHVLARIDAALANAASEPPLPDPIIRDESSMLD